MLVHTNFIADNIKINWNKKFLFFHRPVFLTELLSLKCQYYSKSSSFISLLMKCVWRFINSAQKWNN